MMPSLDRDVLAEIVVHKRGEVAERRARHPLETWRQTVRPGTPGRLEAAFRQDKAVRLMLEIKPASPSAGILAAQPDIEAIVRIYNEAAVALSVLTDVRYFQGSLDLLAAVSEKTPHPTLCKDFVLDAYQVYEARRAGASAVLLIVKMLTDAELAVLAGEIRALGMTPLIEIQDESELERALALEPTILLINNRNLRTLQMDLGTTERLAPRIPAGILRVAASGIESRADIERLQPFCDGFLIGSLLMRQPSPQAMQHTLRELLA